jgi:2,4-dienoyl-CoA reductase-like NADH-dependent reductase (Old Yellow Enzyme family)
MCQYSAVDGLPMIGIWCIWVVVPQEVQGLIIQEATSVSPEGRISRRLGLWKDEQIEKLVHQSIYC